MKTTQIKSIELKDISQTALSEQELNQLFFLIKNTDNVSQQKHQQDKVEQLKKQIADRSYPILNADTKIRNKAAHSILDKLVALEEV